MDKHFKHLIKMLFASLIVASSATIALFLTLFPLDMALSGGVALGFSIGVGAWAWLTNPLPKYTNQEIAGV